MQNILLDIVSVIVLISVIVSAHIFVYKLLVLYFDIQSEKIRKYIKYHLIISPFIFLGSAFYIHYLVNPVVTVLYYLTGLWLGILTMLTIFFLLYSGCYLASKLFKREFDAIVIGKYVFYAAILISLFGIYHAQDMQIKQHPIMSRSVPDSLNGKKIVQVSDVHLGVILGESFLKQMIKKINDQKPGIVVITGDFFDGAPVDFSYLQKNLKGIKATNGVYFVNGNHEGYFNTKNADKLLSEANVKVLSDMVVDLGDLQIVGVDYKRKIDIQSQIVKIPGYNRDKYNVLLYHEPIQTMINKTMGIDLQLAGHTHYGQIFPFGFITNLIYGSYAYGLNQIDDYYEYTTSGVGGWGPSMRIGTDSEIVVFTLQNK